MVVVVVSIGRISRGVIVPVLLCLYIFPFEPICSQIVSKGSRCNECILALMLHLDLCESAFNMRDYLPALVSLLKFLIGDACDQQVPKFRVGTDLHHSS